MAQYIDKSILVEKLIRRLQESLDAGGATRGVYLSERMKEDSRILSFVNALEVKEVDLEKEIANQIRLLDGVHMFDDGKQWWKGTYNELSYFAKYFYELGLKAQKEE